VAAHACTAPCRRILKNVESYPDAEILIERIKAGSSKHGIDVRNFNKSGNGDLSIIDLVDRGIIDPLLVVKNAWLFGSSIASVLLSAECAVV
jgi:chaperonin GroEL (HSP60 family)